MSTGKKAFGLVAALAVVLVAGLGFYAYTQDLSESDVKQLDEVRTAYMDAMNSIGQPNSRAVDDFLGRHVDMNDFQATFHTGQVVTSAAEFKQYVETMKGLLGVSGAAPQGRYEIKGIKTHGRIVTGDTLFSMGSAEEMVQAVSEVKGKRTLGQPLNYSTLWGAVLKKDQTGHWKLHRANVKVVSGIDPSRLGEIKKIAAASLPNLKTSAQN